MHSEELIEQLVTTYEASQHLVSKFMDQLLAALNGSPELMSHVHSLKARLKAADRLRNKLERKASEAAANGETLQISPADLLTRITDLAGVRILHLYTRQIQKIDPALRDVLAEEKYALLEGPFARTWDDESRAFLEECGIKTQPSPSLYTSVHYVVGSASRTQLTCEIQVRTLMEEVWGEVDHTINYPSKVKSFSCGEQLKVLARMTSSATRLVDSIFLTLEHERAREGKGPDSASKV